MGLSDSFAQGQTIFVHGDVPKVINYSDATYTYTCLAKPGTALSASKWRVFRTTTATGDILHASNFQSWGDPATDLTTVQGLSYS